MKISVVIPLYNKERSILRAINSVLNQTEQDFELIVVNDGSSDQSASLVANLLDDVKIRLINQENAGVSAARNHGVAEARSDLIAFLDADDEWLPDFLTTILELRSKFLDASVFGTIYSFQDRKGELSLPKTAHLFENGYMGIIDNYLEIIRIGPPFNSSSFAVTKEAFDAIGGFQTGIKFGEDVDIWIRLSLIYKIAYINKPLAIYHQDAENRACDLYYPSMDEYYPVNRLVQMIRRGEMPVRFRQSAIEYIAKYQLAFARHHLYYGRPACARELLETCKGTKENKQQWILLYVCTFAHPALLQSIIKMKSMFRNLEVKSLLFVQEFVALWSRRNSVHG